MNPQLCREHLAELLQEQLELLTRLQTLLDQERSVIDSRDLKGLKAATEARQQCVTALAGIEDQINALCRMHGHSADRAGLERLSRWCDPRGELTQRLRQSVERALRCRELNDRNGILVSARLKHVGALLQSLTGRNERVATYGPRGYLGRATVGRILGAV